LNIKKVILAIIGIFIIEFILLYIGFSIYIPSKIYPKVPYELRVGIMPSVSHEFCKEKWNTFFEQFNGEKTEITVKPFYATSFDELIYGFKNNNLDIIYINAAIFLELQEATKQQDNVDVANLLIHKYSDLETRNNRSVLLSTADSEYISDTEGKRITFTDKKSITGYIIPYKYLTSKMPKNKTIENWFSKIDYSLTKDQAVLNLIKKNKTDIIAIDSLTLKEIAENHKNYNNKCKILWRSQPLPENIFCMNMINKKLIDVHIDTYEDAKKKEKFNKKSDNYMNVIYNFKSIIYKNNKKTLKYNVLSKQLMLFETPTNQYKEKLEELNKYLKNNKKKQENVNILMQTGKSNVK